MTRSGIRLAPWGATEYPMKTPDALTRTVVLGLMVGGLLTAILLNVFSSLALA